MARVPFAVRFNLGCPVVEATLGQLAPSALVAVPIATVDENHLPARRKDDVWRSRQVSPMQAEAIPEPVQKPTKDDFRLSVFRPHARHDEAAAVWGDVIDHAR